MQTRVEFEQTWLEKPQEIPEAVFWAVGADVDAVKAAHHWQGGVPENAASQKRQGKVCQAPHLLDLPHLGFCVLDNQLPDLQQNHCQAVTRPADGISTDSHAAFTAWRGECSMRISQLVRAWH